MGVVCVRRDRIIAAALLSFALAVAAVSWIRSHQPRPDDAQLQQQVLAIAAKLRVSGERDTMTAATSPEPAAQHMRFEIQERLLAGETSRQILSEMEREYGPDVLAAPAFAGWGSLVWLVPWLMSFMALFGMVWLLRRSAQGSKTGGADGSDEAINSVKSIAPSQSCGLHASANPAIPFQGEGSAQGKPPSARAALTDEIGDELQTEVRSFL
jgi:cytochrome c-type biogenesis protein CcmH/NrfF